MDARDSDKFQQDEDGYIGRKKSDNGSATGCRRKRAPKVMDYRTSSSVDETDYTESPRTSDFVDREGRDAESFTKLRRRAHQDIRGLSHLLRCHGGVHFLEYFWESAVAPVRQGHGQLQGKKPHLAKPLRSKRCGRLRGRRETRCPHH